METVLTRPVERCGPARTIEPSDLLLSPAAVVEFAHSIGLDVTEGEVTGASVGADAPLPGARDPATRAWRWDRNAVRVWAQRRAKASA